MINGGVGCGGSPLEYKARRLVRGLHSPEADNIFLFPRLIS